VIVPFTILKVAMARVVGPVKVLFQGVDPSVRNFWTASWFAAAPGAHHRVGERRLIMK